MKNQITRTANPVSATNFTSGRDGQAGKAFLVRLFLYAFVALAGSLALAAPASAQCTSEIGAAAAGRYNHYGNGYPEDVYNVYLVQGPTAMAIRHWIVFNIPNFTVAPIAAELRLFSGDITGSSTYQVRAVTTPVSTLLAYQDSLSIFQDLGDGGIFGTRALSGADANQTVVVPLNAPFLTALNAARGRSLAIGGEIDRTAASACYAFSGAHPEVTNALRLVLTFPASEAPYVYEEPISRTNLAGETIRLFVGACGTPPLDYHWRRDGAVVPGTNSTLTLPNLRSQQAGTYDVIVSNSFGAVTSAPATVVVHPLLITQEPVSQSVLVANEVQFSVNVSSFLAVSYRWLFNGASIPNGTESTLWLGSVVTDDAGDYSVIVSNAAGAVTSAMAHLEVRSAAPTFQEQPQNQDVPWGDSVHFYAWAIAGPPPTYQWQFNGVDLPGQTGPYLQLYNVTTNDIGQYQVIASNPLGRATSAVAVLTVHMDPPVFIEQPSGRSALVGEIVSLYSYASGNPYPAYQWQHNGVDVPGATTPTLSLGAITPAQAGDYRVIASNPAGRATSAVARLTVSYQAPVFFSQPQSQTVLIGTTLLLYGCANGGPPPVFQWQFNGVDIPNATNCDLTLANLSLSQMGDYWIIASNVIGVVTSQVARVVVRTEPPVFIYQPSGAGVNPGAAASFCATASGGPAPTYQWQFNAANIPAATNNCLHLYNVTRYQAGEYRVIASNPFGSATSQVALLTVTTVLRPPDFYNDYPYTQTVPVDSPTSLSAPAWGTAPISYQWVFKGTNIPGATNYHLDIPRVTPDHAGPYWVTASNAVGSATGPTITLQVIVQAPVITSDPYDQIVLAGYTACLYASVTAGPVPDLQWFRNGEPVPGATNETLCFEPAQIEHSGDYQLMAGNIFGVATSAVARFSVQYSAPVPASSGGTPASYDALEGGSIWLYAPFNASPPPAYQWQLNGVDIPGANASSLILTYVTTNQAGEYSLIATNILGAATSVVARLTVHQQAPAGAWLNLDYLSVPEGSRVVFNAGAQAGPPPTYYLRRDGTNLLLPQTPGGFSILEASTDDTGIYSVLASNYLGTCLSAGASLQVTPATPLDRWSRRNPLPQGYGLLALTCVNDEWLAVGEHGAVVTSADGVTWASQPVRIDVTLQGLAYGQGRYVAVGLAGNILTSPDGVAWTLQRTGGRDLAGVAFGNGVFAAVGDGNAFLVSSNGVEWTEVPVFGVSDNLRAIVFANGRFVATGDRIWTSPDGVNWTVQPFVPSAELECVTFANGLYVAAGDNGYIATSPDAQNWTSLTPVITRRLLGVAYGNGAWVAVGAKGNILRSANGSVWTRPTSPTPDRLETVVFAKGVFVAVGENGTTLTSADGSTWVNQSIGTRRDLDGMTSGNGLLVIVGKYGTILTSTDGIHFPQQTINTINDLHGVGFGDGQFVAVGDPGVIATSPDGTHWTLRNSGVTNYLKSAAYGNGVWVVIGSYGIILTSPDGVTWTRRDAGSTDEFQDVAFGNGKFVIVGDDNPPNGTIFVSTDGVNWQNRSLPTSKNLRGVTWANDLFMVVGNDGYMLVSSDGDYWQPRTTGIYRDGDNLRAATYANGTWLVVGNEGMILASTNTVNWSRRASRTLENLHGVAGINGAFVTMGNRGTVLQSARLGRPILLVRNYYHEAGFELAIQGEAGPTYRLQASTDLRNWTDLLTFANSQETTVFRDETAIYFPCRFYRVVSP